MRQSLAASISLVLVPADLFVLVLTHLFVLVLVLETECSVKTIKSHGFDHEKLDGYQLELQFIAWVKPLIEEVKTRSFLLSMGVREVTGEYLVEDEDDDGDEDEDEHEDDRDDEDEDDEDEHDDGDERDRRGVGWAARGGR